MDNDDSPEDKAGAVADNEEGSKGPVRLFSLDLNRNMPTISSGGAVSISLDSTFSSLSVDWLSGVSGCTDFLESRSIEAESAIGVDCLGLSDNAEFGVRMGIGGAGLACCFPPCIPGRNGDVSYGEL